MKTIINNCIFLSYIFFLFPFNSSFAQEWETNNFGNYGNNIDFLDANTGFPPSLVFQKFACINIKNGVNFPCKLLVTNDRSSQIINIF